MAQQQCTPVNRNYGINWCEFYGPRYVAREAEPHVTYGMGFSRVYDRAGFAQLNSFDQVGAAGLSTTIQHACCIFGVSSAEDLPRITGIHNIAEMNINGVQFLFPPPPPTWPQIPAVNAQANLGGIDNTMKTPHAYTADFSIQRELPQRFSIQLAYVGRFSLIESRKAVCTGQQRRTAHQLLSGGHHARADPKRHRFHAGSNCAVLGRPDPAAPSRRNPLLRYLWHWNRDLLKPNR